MDLVSASPGKCYLGAIILFRPSLCLHSVDRPPSVDHTQGSATGAPLRYREGNETLARRRGMSTMAHVTLLLFLVSQVPLHMATGQSARCSGLCTYVLLLAWNKFTTSRGREQRRYAVVYAMCLSVVWAGCCHIPSECGVSCFQEHTREGRLTSASCVLSTCRSWMCVVPRL